MEDYKQKYEEAFERAKGIYDETIVPTPTAKGTCEYIFPELKESEDEEIRKSIIGFLKTIASLKDGKTVSNEDFDSVALLEWAAWLEKQDPKKHEEELEKAYRCADEVQYRKGYEDAKREIENQNEQKTTDEVKPKFKVGDTIVEKDLDEYDYETIKDIKDGQYIFTDGYCMNIDEQEGWQLVKTTVNKEQKSTWSEEDERLQQCLIRDQKKCLEEVKNDKVGHSEIISDLKEMYHERIDWLKSLKDRIKGE